MMNTKVEGYKTGKFFGWVFLITWGELVNCRLSELQSPRSRFLLNLFDPRLVCTSPCDDRLYCDAEKSSNQKRFLSAAIRYEKN